MPSAPVFDAGFRARLRELLIWRRDVRRFRPDLLPQGLVEKLLELVCLAPSVGLSQPWRFILVDDPRVVPQSGVISKPATQRRLPARPQSAPRNTLG